MAYYSNNRNSNGFGGNQKSRGFGQSAGFDSRNSVKKSAATYSRIKSGKHEGLMAVNAWRKTKNGLVTASCFPVDGIEHQSKDGKTSLRYVVEVVHRDMGTTQTYWTLMSKDSKKIFIKELGLVISPNGNGISSSGKRVTGYFGKAF